MRYKMEQGTYNNIIGASLILIVVVLFTLTWLFKDKSLLAERVWDAFTKFKHEIDARRKLGAELEQTLAGMPSCSLERSWGSDENIYGKLRPQFHSDFHRFVNTSAFKGANN